MTLSFSSTAMNSNRGLDPMLSSLIGDNMWNTKIIAEPAPTSIEPLSLPQYRTVSPVPDVLLSPASNPSYSEFEFLWGSERKRVTSIKMEEDETFSSSPCSLGDVDSSEIDMEDCDIKNEVTLSVMDDDGRDIDNDTDLCESNLHPSETVTSSNYKFSDEEGARRYVEDTFTKIAFVPSLNATHREKIQYILSHSDCREYSLEDIVNLDKRSADSARVCAKIVQNIPQRYRWECVKPEEIPCCYTIVADCKKLSTRDKPPRPMNAFMIWAQGARRLINELCPKMQNAAISEALGFYWRQKSDSFKKRFEIEKVKLRRFHNVEFPHYKYKPKTKVQKAKEKKELSLSKCKITKSAVKREKVDENDEDISRRKSKYGRPRKIKQMFEPEQKANSKSDPHSLPTCVEPVKKPPTKPAIKDMLTLKILNDRRSKEMAVSKNTDPVQNCLGQLSPLYVDNSSTGDIFDELKHCHNQTGHHDHQFLSSSVYDTPANTPPIDENNHPGSPLQTPICSTSQPASHPRSPVPQQKTNGVPTCTTSQLSPREKMPSLKAILSSGSPISRQNSQLRRPLPVLSSFPPTLAKGHVDGRKVQSDLSTDLMLTYVSEILNSPNCCAVPKSKTVSDNKSNSPNQGNVCDVNNNCTWQMSRYEDHILGSTSDPTRPKSPIVSTQGILDFNDLDTLSLDLNVPLLSDDIMKSIMNTL